MREQVRQYLKTTREPWIALLLLFPVYLLYQVGLALTPGVRNGADMITDLLLMLGRWDPRALWGLGGLMLVGYAVVLARMRQKRRFSAALFGLVALEGAAHGVVMFLVINRLMRMLLLGPAAGGYPLHVDVILSLGAGFHEELVFRALLFGGSVWVASRFLKKTPLVLVLGAALLSSLVFSAVHYVGPLGDRFAVTSFVFRFLAGCYFATVYRVRGLAVAVYTHAIYDIGVFAAG
jgi:hypothetical protein